MEVLQTSALPLGYGAGERESSHAGSGGEVRARRRSSCRLVVSSSQYSVRYHRHTIDVVPRIAKTARGNPVMLGVMHPHLLPDERIERLHHMMVAHGKIPDLRRHVRDDRLP